MCSVYPLHNNKEFLRKLNVLGKKNHCFAKTRIFLPGAATSEYLMLDALQAATQKVLQI